MGLSTFLPGVRVVCADIESPSERAPNVSFQRASVTALPYRDRSIPAVSCIDVLEHLPEESRPRAIAELVRVARVVLLLACPHGETARNCDEEFRVACAKRGRTTPPWLAEHQAHRYPTTDVLLDQIAKAAASLGRDVRLSVIYNEPARVARLVRAAAARSPILYVGVALLFGALFPLMSIPDAGNSYRVVVVVEFTRVA